MICGRDRQRTTQSAGVIVKTSKKYPKADDKKIRLVWAVLSLMWSTRLGHDGIFLRELATHPTMGLNPGYLCIRNGGYRLMWVFIVIRGTRTPSTLRYFLCQRHMLELLTGLDKAE